MSKGRQKIIFEGLLQKEVLDTFTVIRGFADLHDLALVSKAMPYQPGVSGQPTGYQRKLDDDHIGDIEKFLTVSPYRFFPDLFPEVAERETRSVFLPAATGGLSAGGYAFKDRSQTI